MLQTQVIVPITVVVVLAESCLYNLVVLFQILDTTKRDQRKLPLRELLVAQTELGLDPRTDAGLQKWRGHTCTCAEWMQPSVPC